MTMQTEDSEQVGGGNGDERQRLRRIIVDRAIDYGEFTLASGETSGYYIDLRRITLAGDAAPLIGRSMLELTADLDYDAVGGPTLGADPIADAMLHAAAVAGRRLDAFVVRKAAKNYGAARLIEGPDIAGRRVLAVEDTSTTGGSVLKAVEGMRTAGAQVVGLAVIADRNTGARERITSAGLDYRVLFQAADLGLDEPASSSPVSGGRS